MASLIDNTSGEFDEIDRQIIQLLQKDGRASYAQMAQELKVSPGMIRMRYNRLVEMGVIKIVAITNPLRMGYQTMALIGIKTEPSRILEVAEKIAALDEVIYLILVTGAYDIIAEIVCKDQSHLLNFLTDSLYKVDGVHESKSFMHLKILKEIYF